MTTSPAGQPAPPADNLVEVGVVAAAHGRDGRLRVAPNSGGPARFRRGAQLFIAGHVYAVDAAQPAPGGRLLVKLDGVDDRRLAAALVGSVVAVDESDLPPTPPDVYYHYQLIGMTVVGESGEKLGTLTEIVPAGGANDVYVVTAEARELLLPAVGEVILNVDAPAHRMTAVVPPGLEWRALAPPKPGGRQSGRRRRRGAAGPPSARVESSPSPQDAP